MGRMGHGYTGAEGTRRYAEVVSVLQVVAVLEKAERRRCAMCWLADYLDP